MIHLTKVKRKWSGDPAENRSHFIGGSDVGTILGLNEWKSAYTLWAEKTGRIQVEDISDVESVWWGNEMEDLVAKRFCMKTGKKVKKSGFEFTCEEYPFLVAHVDRLLLKESAVLECKTTSSWNKYKYSEGEIPPSHYAQVQFYLAMTGLKTGYLATKRDNQFYITTVVKNYEFIDMMLQKCIEFWNMVENDEAPDVDGSDSTAETLAQMYGADEKEETVDLTAFADELNARDTCTHNINAMKSLMQEYDNRIKDYMKTATRGIADGYMVTWKENKNGTRTFRVNKRG